jgi:ribonucleoside-diphosphate reductase alpha chain
MLETIIKRDGRREKFTDEKASKWLKWAGKGLYGRVDWTTIVLGAIRLSGQETTSQTFQLNLIDRCLAMKDYPHNMMAGRLYAAYLHKKMYGDKLPTVKELYTRLSEDGFTLKFNFTDTEWEKINSIIDHTRDYELAHFQIKQIVGKYSIQDRVKKIQLETPQFVYMRMAMALVQDEVDSDTKMKHLENLYNEFSFNRINPPSPNYINLGTKLKGFISCCLVVSGDSIPSLDAGRSIAYRMTAMSAGIGIMLDCRSIGDPVRGGQIPHNGKMPYQKDIAGSVKSNIQAGRAGACTSYFTCFDPEWESMLMAYNPRTPEDKRNRDIHFAMTYNYLFAERVRTNQPIFLFNIKTAPDLHALYYSGDHKAFKELYEKYECDPNFDKKWLTTEAREMAFKAMNQAHEVSTFYMLNIDEVNRHTSYQEPIHSGNLCVAPSTQILTDKGYFKIEDLQNQEVNVWNGEEWSKTTIYQTSELAKLVRVYTDSGNWLDCTLDHKWYIQDNYDKTSIREVRTHELRPGMMLIKSDFPVIEGEKELDRAYINGFFTGDGCNVPRGQRVYLYDEKIKLKHLFDGVEVKWTLQPEQNRIYTDLKDLQEKFFVPDASYTTSSRLKWLAGIADSDGSIYRNDGNQQLVISSINKGFLEKVSMMLNTLGCSPKIRQAIDEGYRQLPANDGINKYKDFFCQKSYRLIITSIDLQKLLELGIIFHRLDVVKHQPQRDARHFVRILEVEDLRKYDRTFCFTEPKRHMGVFNGILTGQCIEVTQPAFAYEDPLDLHSDKDLPKFVRLGTQKGVISFGYNDKVTLQNGYVTFAGNLKVGDVIYDTQFPAGWTTIEEIISKEVPGEVSLCALAAIVEPMIKSDAEYEQSAYYALYMIDKCIHLSEFPYAHIGFTARQRLNAGVGIVGVAETFAREKVKIGTQEGFDRTHRMAERHSYFVIKASIRHGKEKGNAPWIHKTRWANGWLPIDTYKRQVDEITTQPLVYDWEELRSELIANKGMRFSSLIALMPTESSSKASGRPNGPYFIRELFLKKSDQDSIVDWCAPDGDLLGDHYQSAYSISNENMIKYYAVWQKTTDQSISADFYEDRTESLYLSETNLLNNFLTRAKYGLKGSYYQNSLVSDQSGNKSEIEIEENCTGGGCKI